MVTSTSSTRGRTRVVRRIVLAVVGLVALVALLAARPWSSRNSFRQMRIFAPSERIHNFRAMDELFPARTIHKAPTPHHFEVRERELPKTYSFGGRTASLEEYFDRTVTTGFLVLQGNTLLAERYFRGASADTPMTSWSVAKSVVSLLIGIARDEHRMKELTAPLSDYVPDLRGAPYGNVSLRDALTMSSGIRFSEQYDDPLSDIHTMFARIFYFKESAAHYLSTRSAEAPPGTRFHYASSDTLALGLALRAAVKRPLTEYLEEKIWKPLGMEYDASWNTESDDGAELAFCCLNVRLRDYAKIGRLVARSGDWDGQRIVSEDWIRESTRTEAARAPGKLPLHPWGYQYQWWLPGRPGVFMAAGVWGQFIYVDPAREFVIVKTGVDPDFMAHADENVAVFEAIEDVALRLSILAEPAQSRSVQ
jgi:CubicO group peptidase (beta-lactamase class C family)